MSGISEDYTNKVLQMHMHALTMGLLAYKESE